MAKVFISYRRADSAAVTGRIYDRLVSQLGRKAVFKDVDDIPPGVNFATYVEQTLRQCAVLLVVIGPHWLDAGAPVGSTGRRMDDPGDWVRLEVETALGLGLTLIPVLVDGGQVPKASDLPETLQVLRLTNAVLVRNDPDFTHDMERVIAGVRHASTPLPKRAAPPPKEEKLSAPPPTPRAPQPAVSPPAVLPASPTSSTPSPARWRSVLLVTLALALVVGALGVLLTPQLAGNDANGGAASAHQTQTANAQATAAAHLAAIESATASQVAVQETETATALLVHFPYRAPAPGPACDKGNATWELLNGTSQSELTCATTYTRLTGTDVQFGWTAASSDPFPQNYTVSVEVRNVGNGGFIALSVGTSGRGDSIFYFSGGEGQSQKCLSATEQSQCANDNYTVNPSGTHTLSLTVNGAQVTFALDGHAFSSDTAQAAVVTSSVGIALGIPGGPQPPISADVSNFSIG
jgi:hypothetical protein